MWITRSSGFATRQTSLTPSAQTCGFSPCEPEPLDRRAGQVPLRPLGEHGHAGDEVGARLEVRQLLAVAAAPLVAGADAADAAVVDEQLRRRRLGQDHRARLLGLARRASGRAAESEAT